MTNLKKIITAVSSAFLSTNIYADTLANIGTNGLTECPSDNFCIVLKKDSSIPASDYLKLIEHEEMRSSEVDLNTNFINGWDAEKFIPHHLSSEHLPPKVEYKKMKYSIISINSIALNQCSFEINPASMQKNQQFLVIVSFDGTTYSCKNAQ